MGLAAQEMVFPKGKVVFDEKDHERSMFIIKTGSVEVFKTKGVEKIVLAHLGAGEYFGEMSFFDEQPRSACVATLEDTKVIKIMFNEEMKKQLETVPSWITTILKGVFTRLRRANERVKLLESTSLTFNYKEMKGDCITDKHIKDLWRLSSLFEFIHAKDLIAKNNKKYIDQARFLAIISDFFPQLSFNAKKYLFFLETLKIVGKPVVDAKDTLVEVLDVSILGSLQDFLKGTLMTNEAKLQLTQGECHTVEAIVDLIGKPGTQVPGKPLESLEVDLDVKSIEAVMMRKFSDNKTVQYIKSLAEKMVITIKSHKPENMLISASPDDLARSLPFLKQLELFSEIILKQETKN